MAEKKRYCTALGSPHRGPAMRGNHLSGWKHQRAMQVPLSQM